MYYKAPDNSLHFIEPQFSYLLPAGSVPITEEEANAIRLANQPPIDPKDAIRAQINALYAAAGVEEKSAWLLESGMASMLALAATQGITEPDLYALNPGYRQVKDAAAQIAALKAQL